MAQIDPSIVLGIRPPAAINPLEQFSKIQGIRNMISQQQERAQQIELQKQQVKMGEQNLADKQKADAADAKMGELIAANTTTGQDGTAAINHPAVIKGLAQSGHGVKAREYETTWRADQKTQIDNQKAQLANFETKNNIIGQTAGALLGPTVPPPEPGQPEQPPPPIDPNAFNSQRAQLIQAGVAQEKDIPTYEALVQSGQDPRAWLTEQRDKSIKSDEQIKNHQKDLEFANTLLTQKQQRIKDAPATYEAWNKAAANAYANANSQEQWDAATKSLTEGVNPAPLGVLRNFGEKFSPEAKQRAQQLGLTNEQRNVKPVIGSRVSADTGDVTPTVTTVGPDGVPVMTTGAPAKGIAKSSKNPTPLGVALDQARAELGDEADQAAVDKRANEIYAETRRAGTRVPVKTDFTPFQIGQAVEKHNRLGDEEQKAWAEAQRQLDIIQQIPQKDRTIDNKQYQSAFAGYNKARQNAVSLQDQQKSIRQLHKFGGFAPDATDEQKAHESTLGRNGAAAASQAATTPKPSAPVTPKPVQTGQAKAAPAQAAPPTNLLKEGVITKFKNNGQRWTLRGGKPIQVDESGNPLQ